jgi:hypothetical protein
MRPVLAVLVLASLPAIALAVPVNPTATDQVAAVSYDGYGIRLLRTNGEVWSYAVSDYGWLHEDGTQGTVNMTLPIPVSEVADWSYYFLFTQVGVLWQFDPNGPIGWHVVDFPPPAWGGVPIQQQSLGGMKRIFK